jgi:hypothetical protein
MYVLPRGLESAWSSARKKAWVPIVPFGETILGMAAMAMVMNAYKVSLGVKGCAIEFADDSMSSTSLKRCRASCAG